MENLPISFLSSYLNRRICIWNPDGSITVVDGFFPTLNKDIDTNPVYVFLKNDHYQAVYFKPDFKDVSDKIMQRTPRGQWGVRPITIGNAITEVNDEKIAQQNTSNM